MFSRFKSKLLYIQVKENSFVLRSVIDKKSIVINANLPFSTNRLLIGEFSIAEEVLKSGIKEFDESFMKPTVVIHPMENIDDKLSEVEKNVLKELAFSIGAKDVKIWLGEELSDKELLGHIE
jgi:hypothetical protein